MSERPPNVEERADRDARVRRALWLEGAANAFVLGLKLVVGVATGSAAILGDAVHSLADVANNVVALVVVHHASAPPDEKHPYGHRKFETLAVFVLGVLLAVVGIELVIRTISADEREVVRSSWALWTMLVVLAVNIAIATWQARQARILRSDILAADASHTLADVLTTVVAIVGWQFAAGGYRWVDTVAGILVACVVLRMALGLFRRAVPVLVDEAAIDPDRLRTAVDSVPGVVSVERPRSRQIGERKAVDVTVVVGRDLSAVDAHAIADRVEASLRESFGVTDVSVHVEPLEAKAD